jgi:hypothetical protein
MRQNWEWHPSHLRMAPPLPLGVSIHRPTGELACRAEILTIPQLQKVFGDGIRPALPICDEPHRFHLDGFWSGQAGNSAAPQLDR